MPSSTGCCSYKRAVTTRINDIKIFPRSWSSVRLLPSPSVIISVITPPALLAWSAYALSEQALPFSIQSSCMVQMLTHHFRLICTIDYSRAWSQSFLSLGSSRDVKTYKLVTEGSFLSWISNNVISTFINVYLNHCSTPKIPQCGIRNVIRDVIRDYILRAFGIFSD